MAVPPISIAAALIVTVLAQYTAGLPWVQSIAAGLFGAAAISFVLDQKNMKTGAMLVALSLTLFVAGPQIQAGVTGLMAGQQTPSDDASQASFQVDANTVSTSQTLNGNTFVQPLEYNTTSQTVDVDPVKTEYVATRSDSGTSDASLAVSVTPPPKATDDTTGIDYELVEKSSGDYKIWINDTSTTDAVQTLDRTFSYSFGDTDQRTIRVKADLQGANWQYPSLYDSHPMSVEVGDHAYSVNLQKTSEVS